MDFWICVCIKGIIGLKIRKVFIVGTDRKRFVFYKKGRIINKAVNHMTEMVIRVILSIIVLIVIIIILSKFTRKSKRGDPTDSLAIMKKRLENEEITEEEYEEAKQRRGK